MLSVQARRQPVPSVRPARGVIGKEGQVPSNLDEHEGIVPGRWGRLQYLSVTSDIPVDSCNRRTIFVRVAPSGFCFGTIGALDLAQKGGARLVKFTNGGGAWLINMVNKRGAWLNQLANGDGYMVDAASQSGRHIVRLEFLRVY